MSARFHDELSRDMVHEKDVEMKKTIALFFLFLFLLLIILLFSRAQRLLVC